jgi:hypothetical protein
MGGMGAFQPGARAQAEELLAAIAAAEGVIVTTVERECEALRGGHMLAARALHLRLSDGARVYAASIQAARSSLWTIERLLPGTAARLEEQRLAFAALLKVELAILAAARLAAQCAADWTPPRSRTAPPMAMRAVLMPAARALSSRSGGR